MGLREGGGRLNPTLARNFIFIGNLDVLGIPYLP